MKESIFKYLLICACALNPIVAFRHSEANAADDRYVLKEFTMNGCGACQAALVDVDALIGAGVDVKCYNTSRDPQAALECKRNYLSLRPAWRLTRTADGAEIGRWYGAGVADRILAVIQTKFPAPTAPGEEEEEEQVSQEGGKTPEEPEESLNFPEKGDSLTLPGDNSDKPAPSPTPEEETEIVAPGEQDAPATLEQIDAELGAQLCEGGVCQAEPIENFRNRATVAEPFNDVGFLNDSLDEWEGRNEQEPPAPQIGEQDEDLFAPKFRREGTPDAPNDARLGDRLTDRAAEHILEGVLCKIDEVKEDAFVKFDDIGARATDRLEGRVQKEFEGAKALIEKRIDEALRDAKAEIRKQIGEIIKAVVWSVVKIGLLLAVVAIVCYVVWKASGLANALARV